MPERFISMLLILSLACSVRAAASPPKMRPYSGIGIVALPKTVFDLDHVETVNLYDEPGVFRRGAVNSSNISDNAPILGEQGNGIRLIVMARKGDWLRVCYDNAGREAWIDSKRGGTFSSWEQFLKGQVSRLLSGINKQYYQIYRQPGRLPLLGLAPKQLFKVLKLEDDWAMVMADQLTIGWLRWRDEDGRLLVGVGSDLKK